MVKILFTGKQYIVTLSPDLVKRMGWKKGTEVIISKVPEKEILYIEEIKKRKR
jgi:hypothetical protein